MPFKRMLLCLLLSTGTLTSTLLYAQNQPETISTQTLFPPLQVQFYLGYQGLRSNEYVLSTNGFGNSRGHLSELIWNSFKNLLFGLNASGEFKRIRYLLQVSTAVNLGENYMYDYDWLYPSSISQDGASNYSRHDIRQELMLEGSARLGFLLLKKDNSRITLGPGLFFSYKHWESFDGEAVYYIDGLAGQISGRAIGYKVLLLAPQIYLEFIQNFSWLLELRLSVAYSPLTFWLDQDNHYSRNLFYIDYGFLGQQIFGELLLNFWNKKHNFAIGVGVSGRYLFETVGNTVLFNADDDGKPTSEESSHKSAAGIEQGSVQVYLGVTLNFPKASRN